MAETHKQVNNDGSIVERKTILWPSTTNGREEVLKSLFSMNGWTVANLYNVSGSHWKVETVCQQLSYKINLYISSVRDEARQDDEFKMQLGNTYPNGDEDGWLTLILGIYVVGNNNEEATDYILSAYSRRNFDFSGNPSIRGTRTKGLQLAKILGFYKTDKSYLFRPDFLYYYIKNQSILEGNASTKKQLENDTKEPLQQIYYGAPGTGKSHEVKKLTGELDDAGNEYDKTNVFRTTFHPDTDYAAFVGCYKPTMKPVVEQYRAVAGKEEDIVYEFVPQAFTDAYVYAYNHIDEPTYLVIEEINRGNCAQIFGDLFQLLDRKADGTSEYTIKADKDLANYLTAKLGEDSEGIKDGKLRLPKNLNILATMNTSDQSLFPMDSAFKRRWNWKYVAISYNEPKSSAFLINVGEGYEWVKFIEQVNKRIFSLTQSEDKELGNFFIKDSIDAEQFKSKVMFYLWYEVLRDEVENSKYFFYYTTTDETGKENNHKFTFKDLYGDNADTILEGFLKYITKKAE